MSASGHCSRYCSIEHLVTQLLRYIGACSLNIKEFYFQGLLHECWLCDSLVGYRIGPNINYDTLIPTGSKLS
jgi:hypothetical protein